MTDYLKKVVMLGDPAVGKTSLVKKFVDNMFDDKYLSTLGAKPVKKVITVNGDKLTLMIWDIAGQSYNLHPTYYSGAKGALMVCDLTRKKTADSLIPWYSALYNKVGDVPVKVLANKSDLSDSKFNIGYVEKMGYDTMMSSAKTGENVEKAFQDLAEMMING